MTLKDDYQEYSREIEQYVRNIDLKVATTQKTKVSKLVFSKAAWQESLTWFAVVQSMVIFLGLMDDVVDNFNAILADISSLFNLSTPLSLPVNITSYIAFMFIMFLFCFGFVGYRYLRLPQTTQMIGAKNNGAFFMLWKQNKELQKEIEELKK